MSPPEPPSPPSGPPLGTCGSRRNETDPAPPSPPRRFTCTSSTNDDCAIAALPRLVCAGGLRVDRNDVDELAAAALTEAHGPVALREQRVVAAAAHVLTRVEACPPLTHEDRPGAHGGARAHLHAEALGVGVAPVAGGGGTLLLRHRSCSC